MSKRAKLGNAVRGLLARNAGLRLWADTCVNLVRSTVDFPRVTVILPFRGEEEHLGACLSSLRRQTYRNFECIAVDDGSTDRGRALVEEYGREDPRFRLVRHTSTRGAAAAQTTGIEQAQGELLLFIEARDWLLPNTIWHRVRALHRNPARDVAGSYSRMVSVPEGSDTDRYRWLEMKPVLLPVISFLELPEDGLPPLSAALIKREVLTSLHVFERRSPNTWSAPQIWHRILRHGYRLVPADHYGGLSKISANRSPATLDRHRADIAVLKAMNAPLPTDQIVPNTPFVFRQPRHYYQAIVLEARSALRQATAAHVAGAAETADAILATLPSLIAPLFDSHLNVADVIDDCLRDFRCFAPSGKEWGVASVSTLRRDLSKRFRRALAGENSGETTWSGTCTDRPCVLFIPHNAYHAREMAAVAHHLPALGLSYTFIDIDRAYRDEGAGRTIRDLRLPCVPYRPDLLTHLRPRSVFVMNDWGGVVHEIVSEANARGIPSFGLVEGVQDYEDTHVEHIGVGRRRRPYQTVTHPLLVGEYDRKFVKSPLAAVVGTPRLEALIGETPVYPDEPLVCINSNFTYGLYTHVQPQWIAGATRACRLAGYDYLISQHPEDAFDLTEYQRAKEPLYSLIRRSSVVVSRFSGVIYEAMALGKPVIYHNPHGERVDTFREPMGAYPITRSCEELTEALRRIVQERPDYRAQCAAFFRYHVDVDPQRPCAERIALRIHEVVGSSRAPSTSPLGTAQTRRESLARVNG